MNKQKYKEKMIALAISYLGIIVLLSYLILTK